jgi:hypothetical protein
LSRSKRKSNTWLNSSKNASKVMFLENTMFMYTLRYRFSPDLFFWQRTKVIILFAE